MIISVIGDSNPSPELLHIAEEVGAELARHDVPTVCGGGRGVMEAVCRGAKSNGGTTIGILPGSDRRNANDWVDVAIPTAMGQARNVLVVKTGEAVLAIGGRYGTLSEIGHALKAGIPVVGVQTWSLSKDGKIDPSISTAQTANEAVEKAIKIAGSQET